METGLQTWWNEAYTCLSQDAVWGIELSKRWTPYRTAVCWYLWRIDQVPVEY